MLRAACALILFAGIIFLATVPAPVLSPSAFGKEEDDKKEEYKPDKTLPKYQRIARLIDYVFLDGQIDKVTKAASDPATYREYAETAYSMNPIDFYYYATPDYRRELLYKSVATVTEKHLVIASPVVGFEVTMSLEALDHYVNLKKGDQPGKYPPESRGRFYDAVKKLMGLEGKAAAVFDFLFVDRTANDAIRQINALSAGFRASADQLDGFANELRKQEQERQTALTKQIEAGQAEAQRLQGEIPPDATPERRQEIADRVLEQQRAVASFQQQLQTSVVRMGLADILKRQAEQQRRSALAFDRIGGSVKDNLAILGKLAGYLQKNKEGIPVKEVDEMIALFQEVGKRERDWKGEFEDLYEIYKAKGLRELENMAVEQLMASAGEGVESIRMRLEDIANLQTPLDGVRIKLNNISDLVEVGRGIVAGYYRLLAWGEQKTKKLRDAVGSDPLGMMPAPDGVLNLVIALGMEAAETQLTFDAIEERIIRLKKMSGDYDSFSEKVKEYLPEDVSLVPSPIAEELEELEKQKGEILKKLEKSSDLYKAHKWMSEKKEAFEKKTKELKKEWETTIGIITDVIGLLDKKMPQMDLAPDQENKDMMLAWYGGKGATFTGWATVTDEGSGINPQSIQLFCYDVASKTNRKIDDVKVIPTKQVERQVLATQIEEARVRYRFDPPADGDYVIWGYARDRAGHATCALANSRHSQEEDHTKWTYGPESEKDRKFLEFVKSMMAIIGCNTDEIFRQRDFHQVRLRIKEDATPAKVLFETPGGEINSSRPVRLKFVVEDLESWFNPADVSVWITDEFGNPVWEPDSRNGWSITNTLKADEGGGAAAAEFRTKKTGMFGRAEFDIPGPPAPPAGIYYACVQVTNGASITSGERSMFFWGDARPWTLISDVRPFKALYEMKDELHVQHTFWNIKDTPISRVKLNLHSTPAQLTKVSADPLESIRAIEKGQREKIGGEHVFRVATKVEQNQSVSLIYECEIEYASGRKLKPMLEVVINLSDPDAQRASYLKGALHYKFQDQTYPVPFGTALSISQVFQQPALGTPKWVEQYIGYGDVRNDAGEYCIRINPVGRPPYRMRLVAKSYAHERDLKRGPRATVGIAGVFGLETSYPLTCITQTINVSTAGDNVFRDNVFDVGTQEIPYYSTFLRAKSRMIPINWEGELSTGGYISPYGHDFAHNPYMATGDFLKSINPGQIETGPAHGQIASVDNVTPGINAMESGIRHANHNGALSILGTLVKSHRFSKGLSYLSKDSSLYEAARIPLVFEKGRPEETKLEDLVTTPSGLKLDRSTKNVQKVAGTDFPYRVEVIDEKHTKETFLETHEITYQSDHKPPVQQYLEMSRKVERVEIVSKKLNVKFLLVSDTGNDRVALVEPSTSTANTVLSGRKEPVSAEEVVKQTYLVCLRGENLVGLFRSGSEIWSWGKDKPETKDIDESLVKPEFAASTPSGTVVICEGGRHRVLEVNMRSNKIVWSSDQFTYPVMASMTASGNYLVVDRDAHQVVEMDLSGKIVWSFGEKGKAGGGVSQLNNPQSAVRIAGGITIIADAGNQRVIHVGKDRAIARTYGPIKEMQWDETSKKQVEVAVPLGALTYSSRFNGADYIINGDKIYVVDEKGQAKDTLGGSKQLSRPEHVSPTALKVTVKQKKVVTVEEPFYVWKDTVRIIKKPVTRVLIDRVGPTTKPSPADREVIPAIGATANWAPGHRLAHKHGLYTAGVATNKDRLRIYVNGGNDNADENDSHVVARAYGMLLRNRLIRSGLDAHDYDRRARTRPRDAWERGWDTFIACAIMEDPKFIDKTFLGQEITAKTFDLAKTYADMLDRYKNKPDTFARDFDTYRGIDSPYALATMFQQLYKRYGADVISHIITFARSGYTREGDAIPAGRYIDPATLLGLYPEARETFEVLGLMPKLLMKFPDTGVKTLDTAYPKLEWDANGLLEDQDSLEFTLIIAEDKRENVIKRIAGIKGQVWDFGQILKPEEAAAKLAERLEGKKVYYWRVEAVVEDGPVTYRCSSPWGAFEIEVKSQTITSDGGDVSLEAANSPLRQFGTLSIPKGAVDGPVQTSMFPVRLPREMGDYQAIQARAFEIDTGGVKFRQPARISFRLTEKDLAGVDRRGLGIYRYEPKENRWDYVGGTLEKDEIHADIEHTSLYAVMYDKRGPEFTDVTDGPDPAYRRDTLSIRFGLRKPTRTTVTVLDSARKTVRTLCKDQLVSARTHEVSMPLAELPEGRYTYVLSGTDLGGREATAVERGFCVSDAPRGAIRGRVSIATDGAPAGALRVFVPDTSVACNVESGSGEFVLEGVAPGKWPVRMERAGLFPEVGEAEVSSGQTTDIGQFSMTDRALARVGVAGEVFTPGGQGERTYAMLELQADRACTAKVVVRNDRGKIVATPATVRELTVGKNVLLWTGNDDRARPLRSGWYAFDVTVNAGGTWVSAGQVRVLLDRGLAKNVLAVPRVFSPNSDGFEDETQVTYDLECEAVVTVEMRDSAGRVLATPAKSAQQRPGFNAVTWDGKGPDGKYVVDGRYTAHVLPAYVSGHKSLEAKVEMLADSQPPALLELTPLNGQKIADGRPVVTARVRVDEDLDPDGLRIKIDECTVVPTKFDPKTGVFSFQPATSLGEGIHIAIAYARDLAGNEAPPMAVSFTIELGAEKKKFVDRVAPTIRLTEPAAEAIVYSGTPLISAVLGDGESGIDDKNIVVHLDGERVCNSVKLFIPGTSGKSWDWYYYEKAIILYDAMLGEMKYIPGRALPPGKHHVRIETMDRQGNPATRPAEGFFTVQIDDRPPKITDLAPAGITALPTTRISAKVSDEGPSGLDPSTFRLLIDGQEQPVDAKMYEATTATFSYGLTEPLAAGCQHSVLLSVRDKAGNRAEQNVQIITVVRDTQPPRIDLFAPSEITTGATVSAAVYDVGLAGVDPESLILHIDQEAIPPAAGEGAGYRLKDGVLEYKLPDLPPGPHVLSVSVHDRAGNRSREAVVGFRIPQKEERP